MDKIIELKLFCELRKAMTENKTNAFVKLNSKLKNSELMEKNLTYAPDHLFLKRKIR